MGEVSMALVQAARVGPGTVVQLAERACVGYDAARYKAKDLVRAGVLVPLGDHRPRQLVLADDRRADDDSDPLALLARCFWGKHGA